MPNVHLSLSKIYAKRYEFDVETEKTLGSRKYTTCEYRGLGWERYSHWKGFIKEITMMLTVVSNVKCYRKEKCLKMYTVQKAK